MCLHGIWGFTSRVWGTMNRYKSSLTQVICLLQIFWRATPRICDHILTVMSSSDRAPGKFFGGKKPKLGR